MPNDPFYRTTQWATLRQRVLRRDGYVCVVPGCRAPAKVVDHIISRTQGGTDTPDNLRSLCTLHDNQIKERPGDKQRKRNGIHSTMCDVDGMPLDPSHPWFRKEKNPGGHGNV